MAQNLDAGQPLPLSMVKEYNKPSLFLLFHAKLTPMSSDANGVDPSVWTHGYIEDSAQVIIPSPVGPRDGTKCILDEMPSFKHRKYVVSKLRSPENCRSFAGWVVHRKCPIQDQHRMYLETEISKFVHEAVEVANAKFHIKIYVYTSVDRTVTIKRSRKRKRQELKDGIDDIVCAVCIEEIEKNDSGDLFERVQLCCDHAFHMNCIVPWLFNNNSCPLVDMRTHVK